MKVLRDGMNKGTTKQNSRDHWVPYSRDNDRVAKLSLITMNTLTLLLLALLISGGRPRSIASIQSPSTDAKGIRIAIQCQTSFTRNSCRNRSKNPLFEVSGISEQKPLRRLHYIIEFDL
jgi:hypothetical protein